MRILDEPVIINENGKRKVVTKRKAALLRLVNKAVMVEPKRLMHAVCAFKDSGMCSRAQ